MKVSKLKKLANVITLKIKQIPNKCIWMELKI